MAKKPERTSIPASSPTPPELRARFRCESQSLQVKLVGGKEGSAEAIWVQDFENPLDGE
jgi:hypothetical protein